MKVADFGLAALKPSWWRHPRPLASPPRDALNWVRCLGASAFFLSLTWWLFVRGYSNLVVAASICGTLIALLLVDRHLAILLTFAYLFLLGDIRRIFAMLLGDQPKTDLLLLVAPVMALLMAAPVLMRLRLNDWLAKAVLVLMAWMTLEMLNPLQGGIAVGVAGALFYLVPMLWFWVGRQYGKSGKLQDLFFSVLLPLSVLAAILGFVQTYIGFLPWEKAWIDQVRLSYAALAVGNGIIRPFGFSVSSAAYGVLLSMGLVVASAACLTGKKQWILVLPLLAAATFLTSERNLIVRAIFALAVVWTFRTNRVAGRGGRFVIAALFLVLGLAVIISSLKSGENNNSETGALVQHQAEGLSHPLNSRESTAAIHSRMIGAGFLAGITHPLGYGLGATTLASGKLGSDESGMGSSEFDVSDMFISLGVVGGIIYLTIIFLVIRRLGYYLRNQPKAVALPVAAVLACTAGGWLIGGQYSVSALVWFLIGCVSLAGPASKSKPDGLAAAEEPLPDGAFPVSDSLGALP